MLEDKYFSKCHWVIHGFGGGIYKSKIYKEIFLLTTEKSPVNHSDKVMEKNEKNRQYALYIP